MLASYGEEERIATGSRDAWIEDSEPRTERSAVSGKCRLAAYCAALRARL